MGIRRWLTILFLLLLNNLTAQNIGEKTSVSLITCGSGNELYSTFGHSALHIYDPTTGLDRVYNYGTFDFDTPNFYVKFCRGQLNYFLNVTDFNRFVGTYQYEGRWVYRQELNLTTNQKAEIFAFLENNASPQNKFYKYDFFYDNCSTRLRDVMERLLGESLVYPDVSTDTTATFRQMIDLYLIDLPWSDLGIDLALGMPCDEEADFREKMFLPDYLMANLGKAKVLRDGELMPLVKKEGLVLAENPNLTKSDASSILWIFWVLMIFCFITGIFIHPKKLKWFDIFFFILIGILGIVIALLWFATEHSATKWNLNLLWAAPSWIWGAILLVRNKPSSKFFKVHAIITFTIVVFWIVIPQSFHQAVIPIVLALAARSWSWQKRRFIIKKAADAPQV
ncbi:DUF4105 domain-containing protein [Cryomorphaceae bacterium 1068]|nr:DUF4105 domain-containing protein [Cryomorphaceae bacterium 1068]